MENRRETCDRMEGMSLSKVTAEIGSTMFLRGHLPAMVLAVIMELTVGRRCACRQHNQKKSKGKQEATGDCHVE